MDKKILHLARNNPKFRKLLASHLKKSNLSIWLDHGRLLAKQTPGTDQFYIHLGANLGMLAKILDESGDKSLGLRLRKSQAHAELKAQKLQEEKTQADPQVVSVNVGDIFYASWGYDMTIVEFFQVVKGATLRKQAHLREINSRTVEGNAGYSGKVVAVPNSFAGNEIIRRRVQEYRGQPVLKLRSKTYLYPWDGRPRYFNRMN